MIEVDDKTSHASEGPTHGDLTVAPRVEPEEALQINNSTPEVPAAPDTSAAAAATTTAAAAATTTAAAAAPAAPVMPSESAPAELRLEPLVLQTGLQAGGQEQYHVGELLRYHDQHFVESVYLAIPGRRPSDAERARELGDLRNGRVNKIEIIERLSAAQQADEGNASPSSVRRVRVEGLPSPVGRRLSRLPVLGYVLRLGRALWRLPLLMQHAEEFEVYALAQQQLIADYVNGAVPQLIAEQRRIRQLIAEQRRGIELSLQRLGDEQQRIARQTDQTLPQLVAGQADQAVALSTLERAIESATSQTVIDLSQTRDVLEAVAMFSDALLDLSNNHANLQAQTAVQVQQIDAALADLTGAITAQQQITEGIRREQHTLADAQQEFLAQEQQAIVETQKSLLADLREELRALSQRQERARAEFDVEARRLQSLADAAATAATAAATTTTTAADAADGGARPPESSGLG